MKLSKICNVTRWMGDRHRCTRLGMHKKYGLPSLRHGKNYPGWVTKYDDSDLIIIKNISLPST